MKAIEIKELRALTPGEPNAKTSFDQDTSDTGWFPGWNAPYPAKFAADFHQAEVVTGVEVLDANGAPVINFYTREGSIPFLSIHLDQWNKLRLFPVKVTTDSIIVELVTREGDRVVPKITFYTGELTEVVDPPVDTDPDPVDPEDPGPLPTIKGPLTGLARVVGCTRFPWTPELPLAGQREYNMLIWHWPAQDKFQTAWAHSEDNRFTFPDHYEDMKERDITFTPVFSWMPTWWPGYTSHTTPLYDPGTDGTDPAHYTLVDSFVTWFAETYKDRLTYFEPENETFRWWTEQYTMDQFCALMTRVARTVRQMAPRWKIVMPGLTEINLNQLRGMKAWCEAREEPLFFDVINVHHYSNAANRPLGADDPRLNFLVGCSPEQDWFYERLLDLKRFCAENFPGLPVWCTEFGYDTVAPSVQRAPAVGNWSPEEVQAMWLVRGYLAGVAAGIDLMLMYNANDENSAVNGGLYTSSGLLYGIHPIPGKTKFGPKPVYGKVLELVTWLNGAQLVSYDEGLPRILVVKTPTALRHIYWMPTSEGKTRKFKLAGNELIATEIPQMYEQPVRRKKINPKTTPPTKVQPNDPTT
jgi:hypothetical protein